jgi:hypothetical protein
MSRPDPAVPSAEPQITPLTALRFFAARGSCCTTTGRTQRGLTPNVAAKGYLGVELSSSCPAS